MRARKCRYRYREGGKARASVRGRRTTTDADLMLLIFMNFYDFFLVQEEPKNGKF